jgi:hypothetical protein
VVQSVVSVELVVAVKVELESCQITHLPNQES